jgi:hypothetical protein
MGQAQPLLEMINLSEQREQLLSSKHYKHPSGQFYASGSHWLPFFPG